MWHAIEARTGRLIHADDGSRYVAYRCPVCEGVVFLRSGRHYARHFAHRSETAQPECELYTPGSSQFVHPRTPTYSNRSNYHDQSYTNDITAPQVCIEPENINTRPRRSLPRWKLCVTIPKSPDSRGWVTYDFGDNSPRTIAMSKLTGGPVTYPADLEAPDFKGLSCSPEVNLRYQVGIMEKQLGLNKQVITPFVNVPGRYKPRARFLFWGREYYFVWPNSFDPSIPAELDRLTFNENRGWSCILSNLPEIRNQTIETWIKKHFSVNLENPSSKWSLLYPFLSSYKHDGSVEIPQAGNFVLGFTRIKETDKTYALTIVNGERITRQLPERQRCVTNLTYDSDIPELFELYGSNQVGFRFSPLNAYDLENQPTVLAEFESPNHRSVTIPMHSVAARKWLDKVRTGFCKITQIKLPEAVRGELCWRTEPSSPWQRELINCGDDKNRRWLRPIKLAQKELDQIQLILSTTSNEVRISFKGIGEHHFLSVQSDVVQITSLPQKLRDKMRWLQNEISLVHRVGHPVSDDISDDDLIDCFHAMVPPPPYTGHYLAICRTLELLGSTRTSGRTS